MQPPVTYERAFTATGSIKVFAVEGPSRRLLACARTQAEAEKAEHKHDVHRELVALRESTPNGRKFWRLATARLEGERSIPPGVRYWMKRRVLGTRFRDIVDPRQLSLLVRE